MHVPRSLSGCLSPACPLSKLPRTVQSAHCTGGHRQSAWTQACSHVLSRSPVSRWVPSTAPVCRSLPVSLFLCTLSQLVSATETGSLSPAHSAVRPQSEDAPCAGPGTRCDPALPHRALGAHASSGPLPHPAGPGLWRTRPVCRMDGQEACVPACSRARGQREGGRSRGRPCVLAAQETEARGSSVVRPVYCSGNRETAGL